MAKNGVFNYVRGTVCRDDNAFFNYFELIRQFSPPHKMNCVKK